MEHGCLLDETQIHGSVDPMSNGKRLLRYQAAVLGDYFESPAAAGEVLEHYGQCIHSVHLALL